MLTPPERVVELSAARPPPGPPVNEIRAIHTQRNRVFPYGSFVGDDQRSKC